MDKLAKRQEEMVAIWQDPAEIKKIFAPNLSESEFRYFMGMSQALQANPFKREIWPVKYKSDEPVQVIVGRDFYRRKAQEQPNYKGCVVDCVREGDTFTINREINLSTGEVKASQITHEYGKKRGKPFGAYAIVFVEGHTPTYVYCELSEFIGLKRDGKPNRFWSKSPEMMIKKCAESLANRAAFQGVFEGTYSEDEMKFSDSPIDITDDDGRDDELRKEIEADMYPTKSVEEPELETAREEIRKLWNKYDINKYEQKNSIKKHCGKEGILDDVTDIIKLRAYWAKHETEYFFKKFPDKKPMIQEEITGAQSKIDSAYGPGSKELGEFNIAVAAKEWKTARDVLSGAFK